VPAVPGEEVSEVFETCRAHPLVFGGRKSFVENFRTLILGEFHPAELAVVVIPTGRGASYSRQRSSAPLRYES
jgi:hypothetical protein